MVQSAFVVLALAASTLATWGRDYDKDYPSCSPANKKCEKLDWWTKKDCEKKIDKKDLKVEKCAAVPSKTKTIWVTVDEPDQKKWYTKTVKSTAYETETKQVDVTKTVTSTNFWTITETATKTDLKTTSTCETLKIIETALSNTCVTVTSTTTYDQTKETCPAKRAVVLDKRTWYGDRDYDDEPLPEICSCLLTSTITKGEATITKTSTETPCVTVTDVKRDVKKATVTATKILTDVKESCSTVKATEVVKKTTTITWTLTEKSKVTSVSTSTSTKLATSTVDPCAAIYTESSAPYSGNVESKYAGDGKNLTQCCKKCFAEKDCVFYQFDHKNKCCTNYIKKRKDDNCKTDSCPKGKQELKCNKPDGKQYGYGACAVAPVGYD